MNMYYFLPLHFHKFLMPMKEGRMGGRLGGGGGGERMRGGRQKEGGQKETEKGERDGCHLDHSQSISYSVPNQITIPPKDTNLTTSLL